MKKLKGLLGKTFKIILSLGLLLFLVVSVFIFTIIFYPQRILNTPMVEKVIRNTLPPTMVLGWQELSFQTTSLSLGVKNFDIRFKNLCLVNVESKMDACLKEGHLAFNVEFGWGEKWGIKKITIHPSFIRGDRVSFVQVENKLKDTPAEEEKESNFWENWPPPALSAILSQLPKLELSRIDISIPLVLWQQVDTFKESLTTWKGGLRLEMIQQYDEWHSLLTVNEIKGPLIVGKGNEGKFHLILVKDKIGQWVPDFFKGHMLVHLVNDKKLELTLSNNSLQRSLFPLSIVLKSDLLLSQRRLLGDIDLVLKENNLRGTIAVNLKKGGRRSPSLVRTQDCKINSDFVTLSELWAGAAHHALNCSLLLPLPSKVAPLIQRKVIPPHVIVGIKSEAETLMGNLKHGELEISFPRLNNKWIEGQIRLNAMMESKGKKVDVGQDTYGNVEGKVTVKKARILKEILADYGLVVPAPIHALDGTITVEMTGDLPKNLRELSVPFSLQTKLASPNQAFNTLLTAKVILPLEGTDQRPRMEGKFLLSNVQLILPEIDLMTTRNFSLPFPDKRIVREGRKGEERERKKVAGGKEKEKPTFLLDLNVLTENLDSIKILSNITPEPIAFGLDIKINQGKLQGGVVKVSPFDLEVLRKKTYISFFNLQVKPEVPKSELSGEVQVVYADYKVILQLAGTLDRPVVLMESQPPLPESDVIAVLLFGRPMNELNTEEGDSVANTQSAISDRAMTLASLYLLASTPVESIGYNPQTKHMAAKIKLDGRTSMTVGTNWDDMRKIGLRRNLGRNFILEAELVQDMELEKSSIWTFLEWYKRY